MKLREEIDQSQMDLKCYEQDLKEKELTLNNFEQKMKQDKASNLSNSRLLECSFDKSDVQVLVNQKKGQLPDFNNDLTVQFKIN
jgi:hypothetical protein